MTDYKILSQGNKIIEDFQKRLSAMRSGRINAAILDSINVDVYGSKMKVKELATVTIPEPSQLWITPFDKSVIKDIEKAIVESNLGVNPVDDGAGLRLNFPPLTEEARRARAKEVGKMLEEARIVLRNHRTDLLKTHKRLKDAGEVTEDDLKRFENDLQKEVDSLNKNLENISKVKQEEIMKI